VNIIRLTPKKITANIETSKKAFYFIIPNKRHNLQDFCFRTSDITGYISQDTVNFTLEQALKVKRGSSGTALHFL